MDDHEWQIQYEKRSSLLRKKMDVEHVRIYLWNIWNTNRFPTIMLVLELHIISRGIFWMVAIPSTYLWWKLLKHQNAVVGYPWMFCLLEACCCFTNQQLDWKLWSGIEWRVCRWIDLFIFSTSSLVSYHGIQHLMRVYREFLWRITWESL